MPRQKKYKRLTKEQAIKPFGSGIKLAAALGVTKGAVSFWESGRPIPLKQDLRLRFLIAPDKFKTPEYSAADIVRFMTEGPE